MAAIITASLTVAPYAAIPVQATHGTINDGTPISGGKWWSRASGDNHRNELVCSTTYPNDCRIPLYLHSSLDNIKGSLTFLQIGNEAIKAMDYLITAYPSTATSRMGFLSKELTSIWDNKVSGKTLDPSYNAQYNNVLTHVPCFLCNEDKHLLRVEVEVNTYQGTDFAPFELTESCDANGKVLQKDVEKTFKHEFVHVMGFTHNPEHASIVSADPYACGTQNVFTTHDKDAILAKYP